MGTIHVSKAETGAARRLGSYAPIGVTRSARQALYAWRSRARVDAAVRFHLERVRRDERRIVAALGRDLRDLDVLEVGPGQLRSRAHVFGVHNRVTALDRDATPDRLDPISCARVVRQNGWGRLIKTAGRKLIGVDRAHARAWAAALGVERLTEPALVGGDIAQGAPAEGAFDVVCSWSVFEHLPDPRAALESAVRALRPGGVLFTSLHLYTSINGHHDIRSFTGQPFAMPLWAHLRPELRDRVTPSAYLNEWRIEAWRRLAAEVTPGAREYQDRYGEEDLRRRMTPALRQELAGYTDEELFTVELVFVWRKPNP